jgi:hypothetical protein
MLAQNPFGGRAPRSPVFEFFKKQHFEVLENSDKNPRC